MDPFHTPWLAKEGEDWRVILGVYSLGPLLHTWFNFYLSMNKCGEKLLINSKTSKVQPLKFGNGSNIWFENIWESSQRQLKIMSG